MLNKEISNCCFAPLSVSTGDEGTSCYVCGKCGKACDIKSDNMPDKQEWEEELKIKLGGFCWTQDGGNGGYSFEEIKSFIASLLCQERERSLEEIKNKIKQLFLEWHDHDEKGNPFIPNSVEFEKAIFDKLKNNL